MLGSRHLVGFVSQLLHWVGIEHQVQASKEKRGSIDVEWPWQENVLSEGNGFMHVTESESGVRI